MGVTIGDDAAKIGKNNHLLAIMRVRLLQKIGLHILTNCTQPKKGNSYKKHTESICYYCGVNLMLHTRILLIHAHKY